MEFIASEFEGLEEGHKGQNRMLLGSVEAEEAGEVSRNQSIPDFVDC